MKNHEEPFKVAKQMLDNEERYDNVPETIGKWEDDK